MTPITWIFILGLTATVDRIEGDTVVIELANGTFLDACAHCFPHGMPSEGDRIRVPFNCPELREVP